MKFVTSLYQYHAQQTNVQIVCHASPKNVTKCNAVIKNIQLSVWEVSFKESS